MDEMETYIFVANTCNLEFIGSVDSHRNGTVNAQRNATHKCIMCVKCVWGMLDTSIKKSRINSMAVLASCVTIGDEKFLFRMYSYNIHNHTENYALTAQIQPQSHSHSHSHSDLDFMLVFQNTKTIFTDVHLVGCCKTINYTEKCNNKTIETNKFVYMAHKRTNERNFRCAMNVAMGKISVVGESEREENREIASVCVCYMKLHS